jgi:uncharacterized damage-inducible protein DinB
MKEWLIEGFAYDAWATDQWLGTLPDWPQRGVPEAVLSHMVNAKLIWLRRCGIDEAVPESLTERFAAAHRGWMKVVKEDDIFRNVEYLNLQGVAFSRPLDQIARQVINHGTYHRGQLRGLAESAGLTNWPETDLLYFHDLPIPAGR